MGSQTRVRTHYAVCGHVIVIRDMGNQLSTWNLTIQSAVDGENFDYNPSYNQGPYIFADYTKFYIGIGATAAAAAILILANIWFGCHYKKYWYSRYTGNRYVLPVFVLPPKDQTPLDI